MRIAVIGSAPSSIQLGPYKDASHNAYLGGKPPPQYPPSEFITEPWEIWCCSPGAFGLVPRADAWFEVHRWEPGQPWLSPEYVQFLQEFRGPVYTGGPVEGLENGVVYPLERVEAEFSSYFLTSSLALMMALAILTIEDARAGRARAPQPLGEVIAGQVTEAGTSDPEEDVIGLWGVDMAAHEEWADQRPGCHFFVLEALRRGIKIYTPRESDLLRPQPVYGISEWDHSYIKATARMRELNGRREQKQQAIAAETQGAQFLTGAIDNMNYMIKTWFSPYGIPAGIRVGLAPGTGLGGGTTLPRPFGTLPDSSPAAPDMIVVRAEDRPVDPALYTAEEVARARRALKPRRARKKAKRRTK